MRNFIKLLGLIYLLLIYNSFSQNLTKVKEFLFNNDYLHSKVYGNYAYVTTSERFFIIDVTSKSNPIITGYIQTGVPMTDVEVVGNTAFVAAGPQGLLVFDVSNKSNPTQIGRFFTTDSTNSIKIVGNYCYMSDWTGGMKILDITNPSSPSLISTTLQGLNCTSVDVKDSLVYVTAGDSGLIIINASNKNLPQRLASYPAPVGNVFWDAIINGNILFIAANDVGVLTVDVSVPSTPNLLATTTVGGIAFSLSLNGNSLFVSKKISGVGIYNIINPSTPTLITNIATTSSSYSTFQDVNYLYVSDVSSYKIYDISILSNPNLVSETISSGIVSDVLSHSNYLYVASMTRGLLVYDVTNPNSPLLVNVYAGGGGVNGMAKRDSFLYLACSMGFQVLNISNPANPYYRGGYTYAPQTYSPFRVSSPSDSVAYVVGGNLPGISVLDIRNINSIQERSRYLSGPIPQFAFSDIASDGTLAFATTNYFGFKTLRLNPNYNLVELGFHNSGGYAGIFYNSLIYIAAGSIGLRIIDITNLTSPLVRATFNTSGDARGVKVYGNYAFVANGEAGLDVINVMNTDYPIRIGRVNTPGNATRLDVKDNLVFVADFGSLLIYSFAPQPTIVVNSPNGGETLYIGSSNTIYWIGQEFLGPVNIKLSTNGGSSFDINVASNVPNFGTYNWVIPNVHSTLCRIKVESVNNPALFDISDADFTIRPEVGPSSITVVYPNGGESWIRDSTYTIQWTSQNITGNVSIFLSTNSGQSYAYTIATSTANNGAFSWKVPTTLGNPTIPILAKIMVVSVVDPSIYDHSDNVFTIEPLVGVEDDVLPTHFSISQNYPNPFNPSTVINYTVPNYSKVRIEVFDVLGRLVSVLFDEFQNQGKYSIKFEAGSLTSGTYIYRMTAGDFVEIRKMNLIK